MTLYEGWLCIWCHHRNCFTVGQTLVAEQRTKRLFLTWQRNLKVQNTGHLWITSEEKQEKKIPKFEAYPSHWEKLYSNQQKWCLSLEVVWWVKNYTLSVIGAGSGLPYFVKTLWAEALKRPSSLAFELQAFLFPLLSFFLFQMTTAGSSTPSLIHSRMATLGK